MKIKNEIPFSEPLLQNFSSRVHLRWALTVPFGIWFFGKPRLSIASLPPCG
jgi:hypothetical protein